MNDAMIARNYAEALFEVAGRHGEEEAYAEPFRALADAFRSDPRTGRFFATPRISGADRRTAVEAALRGRVPDRFLNFTLVVMSKGRQRLLPRMAEEYQTLLDRRSGEVRVEVTLAREPDAAMETMLAERLSALIGQPVRPQITVNPAIIGGMIVRYGDRLLDASLRRQVVALRRDTVNARLPVAPAAST